MKINKKFAFATMAALAATLLSPTSIVRADDDHGRRGDDHEGKDHDRDRYRRIDHQFVILLAGVYKPVAVGDGPRRNLGLTSVNLDDGSWHKVKIYLVSGLPGDKDNDKDKDEVIGAFYVQLGGDAGVVAYDLPGGAFTARFVGADAEQLPVPVPPATSLPPNVSWTLDGTFKLEILETTRVYRRFAGGHIHMVDILKYRGSDGTFLENCFCTIHPKLVAP